MISTLYSKIYNYVSEKLDNFSTRCKCTLHNIITKSTFAPRKPDIEKFKLLNTSHSSLKTILTTNLQSVTYVHIVPEQLKTDKWLVIAHGRKSNIEYKFNQFKLIADSLGANVVSFDYVGYGLSYDTPASEQSCYDSLESVMYELIHVHGVDKQNIIMVGQSLGSGIVVDYAVKYDWQQPIILMSPYKSILSVVLGKRFLRSYDIFCTLDKLPSIKCPVKILHGENDKVISAKKHGMVVYETIPNEYKMKPVWLQNAGHHILSHLTEENINDVLNYSNN